MSKKFILVTLLTIVSVLTFGLTFSFAANNSITSGNNNDGAINNAADGADAFAGPFKYQVVCA